MTATPKVPGLTPCLTAAQLAAVLGLSKRAVQLRLRDSPPAEFTATRGGRAPAWSINQLPEEWRQRAAARIKAGELRGRATQYVRTDGSIETRIDLDSLAVAMIESAAAGSSAQASTAARKTETLNDMVELSETLRKFGDPQKPNAAELALLWNMCGEHWEAEERQGSEPKRIRQRLIEFLFESLPGIAKNRESLRKILDRKLALWRTGGRIPAACEDRRHDHSGRKGAEIPAEDLEKIEGHAVLFCGGRVAQAFRELVRKRELSEAVLSNYLANPASKSYVPSRIRAAVARNVALMEDIHHGPRRARLNGAHLDRDWSKVHAMDWLQADDLTAPVYYYEPDGNGWFTLMRGQVLVMIDLRSTRIVSFVLISAPQYNSLAIRSLITRSCDEHGLPRRGFYFERGIWKTSRILTGGNGAVSAAEADKGLRDLGLQFIHAKLPRAKPVERVLGAMQNWMERCPGYAGRDERLDGYERFERHRQLVSRRKIDPREFFFSADEWEQHLDGICDEYNGEIQNGKMLPGISPEHAFEHFRPSENPPVKLGPDVRYLLAHYRRPVQVTRNGIRLKFGKNDFVYRGEATGSLIGSRVLAWFDPENPDMITVTDLDRRNPVAVERAEAIPAIDATPEQIAAGMRSVNSHNGYARARYRVLKAKFQPAFRRNLVGRDAVELGVEMESQRSEASGRRAARDVQKQRASATARKFGVAPQLLDDERRLAAFEAMQKLREEGGDE